MSHVKVKICGITRPEDARQAADLGADAIGMVFAPSPRQIELKRASEIVQVLPPFVTRVGLFVDASREVILRAVSEVPLDVVQLHGEETPEYCESLAPIRLIKAFRLGHPEDLVQTESYARVSAILLDTKVKGRTGGTGVSFPWEWLTGWRPSQRWILAGGLSPSNVRAALAVIRPYAVDVSSGVEDRPGEKSVSKMASFIRESQSVSF